MEPRIEEFLSTRLGAGFLAPGYDLMLSIAAVLALYVTVRLAEDEGLDPRKVFRACVLIAVAAFVSARLYVVLVNADHYLRYPLDVLRVWDGGTGSMGVYAGGFAASLIAARWQRLPIGKFFDCCAPAVAAGIVIGRLGCFLNGCCYGRLSSLPWAVQFPEGSDAHTAQLAAGLVAPGELTHPIHPTQLYEALFGLVVLAILWRHRPVKKWDGEVLAVFFLLYAPGRFLNEFLRGDPRPTMSMLSLPQVFCLLAVAISAILVLGGWRLGLRQAR